MRYSPVGYSLIEVLGVTGFVLIMLVLAVPSYMGMDKGGKRSAALRNAGALNSVVQQYDQLGGLMTAEVTVPPNVKLLADSELPEMQVLNKLRSTDGASAWQEPIFSDQGYRVIWVNGLMESDAAKRESLSGLRNAAAEWLVEAGEGGRFEMVGPTIALPGVDADPQARTTSLSHNSVAFHAGANNALMTNFIADQIGVRVEGYYFSDYDAVPNIIGLNGSPLAMAKSVMGFHTLWGDEWISAHTKPQPYYHWTWRSYSIW